MRLLETTGADALATALDDEARVDYVYSYPPRQAYRPVPEPLLDEAVRASLARDAPLNLYFHFPFCKQICSFCNLFAVAGAAQAHDAYMESVVAELRHYAPAIAHRPVDTVYLGGGTPSLLEAGLFERLFGELRSLGVAEPSRVPEVALEVAPDTVDETRFREYRALGINRVNLGAQSWDEAELAGIGRRHGPSAHLSALDTVVAIGFDNVCVDLIYGLDGQTDRSWERSLEAVVDRAPDTVCCYPLTVRPATGYGRKGMAAPPGPEQYARYDTAAAMLAAAGYGQQTQVRWAKGPTGGYRQKENHWAGQDVLGLGAGARGYLWHADYRNGYSAVSRVAALRAWAARVAERGHGRDSGFLIDDDERRRKQAVLGLSAGAAGPPVADWFPEQANALVAAGVAVPAGGGGLRLTPRGVRHRDVAVQVLFSDRVRDLVASHTYNE